MVRVDEEVLDPGVIVDGDNVHVTPEGLVQVSEIGLPNPPTALAPTVIWVDCPPDKVALWAETVSEKFALLLAAAGVSVANNPCVWSLPPAVK